MPETFFSQVESWIDDARHRIDDIIKPSTETHFSPEDRVTKTMEIQEDLLKRFVISLYLLLSSGFILSPIT